MLLLYHKTTEIATKIGDFAFLLFARRSADVVWFKAVSPRKAENDVVVSTFQHLLFESTVGESSSSGCVP